MSVNNIPNTTAIIPQYGPGQILVIPPDPSHPQGMSYFVPRNFLVNSNSIQALSQANSQRIIPQATIQPQHQSPPIAINEIEPVRDLDLTNAKIRSIKEKCLSHFIEGQLILETSKPLNELKTKSVKKREKKKHSNHNVKQQKQMQNQHQSIARAAIVKNEESLQTPHALLEPVVDIQIDNRAQEPTRDNSVQKIRAEMPNWSVADVVMFIEKHDDIKQYASKFADDEVDGKALLLMIDRNLNLQWLACMFKHGPAMKIEAVLSKYRLE